ncbi:MAG TPA: glycosyl hydrolase, partial [Chryseosolibacter sp.]|nr:glycosyl hydrolase [Chryseosolibacter sp.]
DILVYFPVCDAFSSRGSKTLTHIDAIGREFDSTAFARCAGTLIKNGYSFDFISDRQISELQIKNGSVVTSGQGTYRALVIPKCKYIPIETLARIDSLAASGIRVIFFEGLPESFAGFGERDVRGQAFSTLIERLKSNDRRRNIFVTNDILRSLSTMELRRENFSAIGLEFIRKKDERGNFLYLLVNRQAETYDGLISLAVRARHVEIFDPMTGAYGRAQVRERSGKSEVYVQLAPGQSLVLRTCVDCAVKDPFIFYRAGQSRELAGNWRVTLPGRATMQTDSLVSWTNWGAAAFSGSAVYEIDFNTPSVKARRWAIDLGDVRESARVYVNERFVGTAIGPRYRLEFPDTLLEDRNHLKVVVSNLMANRIADMDRKKIFWKKFYNINFAARLPENRKDGLFNASEWSPLESGLMGPVRMVPLVPMR